MASRLEYLNPSNEWTHEASLIRLTLTDSINEPQILTATMSNTARDGTLNHTEENYKRFQKVRLFEGETNNIVFYGKINRIETTLDAGYGQVLTITAVDNLQELASKTVSSNAEYDSNTRRSDVIKDLINGSGTSGEKRFRGSLVDIYNINVNTSNFNNSAVAESKDVLNKNLSGSRKKVLDIIENLALEDKHGVNSKFLGYDFYLDTTFNGTRPRPAFHYFKRGSVPSANKRLTLKFRATRAEIDAGNVRSIYPKFGFPQHGEEIATRARVECAPRLIDENGNENVVPSTVEVILITHGGASGSFTVGDEITWDNDRGRARIRAIHENNLVISSIDDPRDGFFLIDEIESGLKTLGDLVGLDLFERDNRWLHSISGQRIRSGGVSAQVNRATANPPGSIREAIESDREIIITDYESTSEEELMLKAARALIHGGDAVIRGDITISKFPYTKLNDNDYEMLRAGHAVMVEGIPSTNIPDQLALVTSFEYTEAPGDWTTRIQLLLHKDGRGEAGKGSVLRNIDSQTKAANFQSPAQAGTPLPTLTPLDSKWLYDGFFVGVGKDGLAWTGIGTEGSDDGELTLSNGQTFYIKKGSVLGIPADTPTYLYYDASKNTGDDTTAKNSRDNPGILESTTDVKTLVGRAKGGNLIIPIAWILAGETKVQFILFGITFQKQDDDAEITFDESIQNWFTTVNFEVTDTNTIKWGIGANLTGIGRLYLSETSGAYKILAGESGAIVRGTWIFFDKSKKDVDDNYILQTTNTGTESVGPGKISIAFATFREGRVALHVFNVSDSIFIDGGFLRAETVNANKIISNTVTATQIKVGSIWIDRLASNLHLGPDQKIITGGTAKRSGGVEQKAADGSVIYEGRRLIMEDDGIIGYNGSNEVEFRLSNALNDPRNNNTRLATLFFGTNNEVILNERGLFMDAGATPTPRLRFVGEAGISSEISVLRRRPLPTSTGDEWEASGIKIDGARNIELETRDQSFSPRGTTPTTDITFKTGKYLNENRWGDIRPSKTNQINFGNPSYLWKEIHGSDFIAQKRIWLGEIETETDSSGDNFRILGFNPETGQTGSWIKGFSISDVAGHTHNYDLNIDANRIRTDNGIRILNVENSNPSGIHMEVPTSSTGPTLSFVSTTDNSSIYTSGASAGLGLVLRGGKGGISFVTGTSNDNVPNNLDISFSPGTSGSVRPSTTNTVDLGTSSYGWKNIYTNNINTSGINLISLTTSSSTSSTTRLLGVDNLQGEIKGFEVANLGSGHTHEHSTEGYQEIVHVNDLRLYGNQSREYTDNTKVLGIISDARADNQWRKIYSYPYHAHSTSYSFNANLFYAQNINIDDLATSSNSSGTGFRILGVENLNGRVRGFTIQSLVGSGGHNHDIASSSGYQTNIDVNYIDIHRASRWNNTTPNGLLMMAVESATSGAARRIRYFDPTDIFTSSDHIALGTLDLTNLSFRSHLTEDTSVTHFLAFASGRRGIIRAYPTSSLPSGGSTHNHDFGTAGYDTRVSMNRLRLYNTQVSGTFGSNVRLLGISSAPANGQNREVFLYDPDDFGGSSHNHTYSTSSGTTYDSTIDITTLNMYGNIILRSIRIPSSGTSPSYVLGLASAPDSPRRNFPQIQAYRLSDISSGGSGHTHNRNQSGYLSTVYMHQLHLNGVQSRSGNIPTGLRILAIPNATADSQSFRVYAYTASQLALGSSSLDRDTVLDIAGVNLFFDPNRDRGQRGGIVISRTKITGTPLTGGRSFILYAGSGGGQATGEQWPIFQTWHGSRVNIAIKRNWIVLRPSSGSTIRGVFFHDPSSLASRTRSTLGPGMHSNGSSLFLQGALNLNNTFDEDNSATHVLGFESGRTGALIAYPVSGLGTGTPGGGTGTPATITASDILDFAKDPRTNADRGKLLGVSSSDRNRLALFSASSGGTVSGNIRPDNVNLTSLTFRSSPGTEASITHLLAFASGSSGIVRAYALSNISGGGGGSSHSHGASVNLTAARISLSSLYSRVNFSEDTNITHLLAFASGRSGTVAAYPLSRISGGGSSHSHGNTINLSASQVSLTSLNFRTNLTQDTSVTHLLAFDSGRSGSVVAHPVSSLGGGGSSHTHSYSLTVNANTIRANDFVFRGALSQSVGISSSMRLLGILSNPRSSTATATVRAYNLSGILHHHGSNNVTGYTTNVYANKFILRGSQTQNSPSSSTRLLGILSNPSGNATADVRIFSLSSLGISVSSLRYKENIEKLPSSSNILNLNPVSFNYTIESEADDGQQRKNIGLIAEDVIKEIPEIVHLNDEGLPESVEYSKIGVLLLNEVKSIKEENKKLREELNQLKAAINNG